MSVFTIVIIIWALYQLGVSLLKKGKQQTPGGKSSDPFKLPDGRSIRETIQGASQGSWREQLQQALQNASYQPESRTGSAESSMDGYVETEGAQGTEGTQGTNETNNHVGILGAGAYSSTEEAPQQKVPGIPQTTMAPIRFSLTERELVQGVMWAEILGKPRALRPFRGPRT